jgi:formamidopyrimidine-DNA glycosylase
LPELPEVETVARGLQTVLPGKHIRGVRLGKSDFIEDPGTLERDLPGAQIISVHRHGKFLLLDLKSSHALVHDFSLQIHLGMTGRLTICSPEIPIAPHTHVFLALDDGHELRYTDPRRFGLMRVLAGSTRDAVLQATGLDPLEASEDDFRARLRPRRARVKALLLDQHVFGGMGNIYTDESLWRARIHPMRLGSNLTEVELHRLYRSVRQVLEEAIHARGSSISDFVDAYGLPGDFQRRHRVYGREGEKCHRCGALVRRISVAGRSSYFCPRCQRAPRHRSYSHAPAKSKRSTPNRGAKPR